MWTLLITLFVKFGGAVLWELVVDGIALLIEKSKFWKRFKKK
jgi:hypothetical protein